MIFFLHALTCGRKYRCDNQRVPIQFVELLVQQSERCLDPLHGLISDCTEVSVDKHLQEESDSHHLVFHQSEQRTTGLRLHTATVDSTTAPTTTATTTTTTTAPTTAPTTTAAIATATNSTMTTATVGTSTATATPTTTLLQIHAAPSCYYC